MVQFKASFTSCLSWAAGPSCPPSTPWCDPAPFPHAGGHVDPDGQWDAGPAPGSSGQVSGGRLCLRLCQQRGGQGLPGLGPWGGEGPEQWAGDLGSSQF